MFRLEQHVGVSLGTGKTVELKQWRIFYGDVLVGYLPQAKIAQIQALFQFPHDQLTKETLEDFALQTAMKIDAENCVVNPPETFSKQFAEEAVAILNGESDDDE